MSIMNCDSCERPVDTDFHPMNEVDGKNLCEGCDPGEERKEAFTKGPWTVGEISDTGGYDCMTAGIKVGPVTLDAADYGQTRISDLPDYIEEKMLADAHLTKAAPEMYEALKDLSEAFQARVDGTGGTNAELRELAAAREALSKARGEAQ